MALLVFKSILFSILLDIQEDMASMKQSEIPSGRNCQNKKAHGDELCICQVKKYSVDRSEDKVKRKFSIKPKYRQKLMRKKET